MNKNFIKKIIELAIKAKPENLKYLYLQNKKIGKIIGCGYIPYLKFEHGRTSLAHEKEGDITFVVQNNFLCYFTKKCNLIRTNAKYVKNFRNNFLDSEKVIIDDNNLVYYEGYYYPLIMYVNEKKLIDEQLAMQETFSVNYKDHPNSMFSNMSEEDKQQMMKDLEAVK